MSPRDLAALAPFMVVSATAVAVMLSIAIHRSHRFSSACTVVSTVAAAGLAALEWRRPPGAVASLLMLDSYSLFFLVAILLATAAVAALSYGYLQQHANRPEEFYVLLLTGALGAGAVATAGHLAMLFLGLEVLSVSLYGLLGYLREVPGTVEAASKYLVLASSSAAVLVFGIAMVYFSTGTMSIGPALLRPPSAPDVAVWAAGLLLILAGLSFKLALVPFHMWTPDVYQGAPVPAAAFVATVSKAAALAVLFRLVFAAGPGASRFTWPLAWIAAASILAGNLLALRQDDIKRILGFSSVANMGYVMVPVVAAGSRGASASAVYMAVYGTTVLAAFGVLAIVESSPLGTTSRDRSTTIADVQGLFWRRPWLAALAALSFMSLAGIPLSAGFVGKFVLVLAGADSSLWSLLIVLAVGSTIGLFYSLRVLIALFDPSPTPATRSAATSTPRAGLAASLTLGLLGVLLLWWGVLPAALIRVAETVGR